MPSTSTAFPLLTQFYGCAIIILVLAMCCSCLVYAMYFMNSSGLQTHESTVTQKVKVIFARDGRGVLSNTLPTRDDFSSSDRNGVLEITLRNNRWLCFFVFFLVQDFSLQWLQPILFGCSWRHRLIAKSRRSRSKIQPMTGTGADLSGYYDNKKKEEEEGKGSTVSQCWSFSNHLLRLIHFWPCWVYLSCLVSLRLFQRSAGKVAL